MIPTIVYQILQFHWRSTGRQATFKMPARVHFVPQDFCTAAVLWQNQDFSLIPIEKLDPSLTSEPLELASIQYEIQLQHGKISRKARLMHEFIGTGKLSTLLTDDAQMIQCKGVLFDEYKVEDVFDDIKGEAAKFKVVQFVS